MRRQYIKHAVLTLALLALDWLTIFIALESEFRRKGEGEPEFVMLFGVVAPFLQVPVCVLLVAACLVFWFRARDGVTRGLRIGLALAYLPLLLLTGVTLFISMGAVGENYFFVPVMLIDLCLMGYILSCFPKSRIAPLAPKTATP